MEQIKKGLKDYESHSANPSAGPNQIKELIIGVRSELHRITEVMTDEVISEKMERGDNVCVLDKFTFVKLFPDAQLDIVKLSSAGIAVLSYVFRSLKKLQDEVYIESRGFEEFYRGIPGFEEKDGKMVCYRGVLNLLQHGLIYRKVGEGHYFININKFFNGDRTKIEWVSEINQRLKNKESVKQSEIKYKP